MSFLQLQLLWLAPLIVLFLLLFFWGALNRRRKIARAVLGERCEDPQHNSLSGPRRFLRFILLFFAAMLLLLAAARPVWGTQIVPYESKGRDLMLLVDTSKSMLADDIKPSRLSHAKWLIRELVSDNRGDRFGLIAFAGRAFLECPLTIDKTSFFQYLDELDTSTIPVGGTNLQLALETALQEFRAAEGANRAVILITDGDELSGNSEAVVAELKRREIPLLIIGIGNPAAPSLIPIKNADGTTSFMRDAEGKLVKSALNERKLIELARGTGGIYVRTSAVDSGLEQIRKRVADLVPEKTEEGKKTRAIERFYYPLAAALLLLLVWMWLSEAVSARRVTAKTLTLLAVFCLFTGRAGAEERGAPKLDPAALQKQLQQLQKNPSMLKDAKGKVDGELLKKLQQMLDKLPPQELYNQALKLQSDNKLPQAEQLYERVLNHPRADSQLCARSCQNMGVIRHQMARERLGRSMQSLRQQQLGAAGQDVDDALTKLKAAEEMYVEAMTAAPDRSKASATEKNDKEKGNAKPLITDDACSVAVDQQLLLLDRKKAEELKKKIDELKKAQQKARKQTQEAKNQQNRENQQKQNQQQQQQEKQQQKEKKQGKQQQNKQSSQSKKNNSQSQKNKQQSSGKEDQQRKQQNKSGEQKNQSQSADDKIKQARKDIQNLQDKARDLQQKNLEKSASEAEQELQKAQAANEQKKGQDAEKHIQKALEKLGGNSGQDQKNNQQKQQNKQQQNKKDQKSPKNNDKNKNSNNKNKPKPQNGDDKLPEQPQQPQKQGAKGGEKENKIDPSQAKKIFSAMARDEKNLRDELKVRMQRQYRNEKVLKDW